MKIATSLLFCTTFAVQNISTVSAFSTTNTRASSKATTTRTATELGATAKSDESIRVVVTGLGVVNGCGVGHEDFFNACLEGKSSVRNVERFDISKMPCTIGSEVPDEIFNPLDWFTNPKNVKSNDRFTHFAVAAARQALQDSGLGDTPETLEDPARIGCMVGTAFGGMETFETQTLKLAAKPDRPKVSPFTIPALLGNTASGVIGIETGCQGPNYGVTSACASGSHAIGEALGMIQSGKVDRMLAGGTEATMTPLTFAGFCAMKAMNTKYNDNPTGGSRPFDAGRGGFIMGEGAGVILLESLESAKKRGAKIYAEMVGYGATCDAYHITTPAPGGRGLAAAMEMAIDESGMDKKEINYINAHGTSTAYNDKFETMAIKSVFGEQATANDGSLVISSTKGVTGHTLGAAGGIEAVIAVKSISVASFLQRSTTKHPILNVTSIMFQIKNEKWT